MPHRDVDICMTNSGDLITVPEWVDRAVILADGVMVDHPLKGRGGDLLLSDELHHFDNYQVTTINLPDGSAMSPIDGRNLLLNKDIESAGKGVSNIGGGSQYNEVEVAAFPASTHTQYGSVSQVIIDDSIRSFVQEIIWRVRTNAPDYAFHIDFGSNMEDIIGEWNTRAVGDYALDILQRQLGIIKGLRILQATAYPTRDDTIIFVVRIEGSRDTIIDIRIAFDFEEGLVISGKKLVINDGITTEAT